MFQMGMSLSVVSELVIETSRSVAASIRDYLHSDAQWIDFLVFVDVYTSRVRESLTTGDVTIFACAL